MAIAHGILVISIIHVPATHFASGAAFQKDWQRVAEQRKHIRTLGTLGYGFYACNGSIAYRCEEDGGAAVSSIVARRSRADEECYEIMSLERPFFILILYAQKYHMDVA